MNVSPSSRRRSSESADVEVDGVTALSSARESLGDQLLHTIGRHALLLQRISITNRHRPILHRLAVDREPEWGPDLVLTTVATSDRSRFVVEHREGLPQLL